MNYDPNNTKSYKTWLSQKKRQDEISQMELARLHQMQAEQQLQEAAKMGI